MNRFVFLFTFLLPALALAAPPTLMQTIEAARRAQGLDGELDDWSSRARWRGFVPRVGAWVGGDRTDELDIAIRETTGAVGAALEVEGTTNTTEDDLSESFQWRVTATWDLRDVVFSPAELAAARETRARQRDRIRLDFEVSRAYFEWVDATDEALARRASQQLDILTGGWFSRGGAR